MIRSGLLMRVTLTAVVAVFGSTCGGDSSATGPGGSGNPPTTLTSIVVTPGSSSLAAIGQTVQLSAEARDQNGVIIAGVSFAWSSSSASVATVSSDGLVRAVSSGQSTVSAFAEGKTGSAAVTVSIPPNMAPTATISSPTNGVSFTEGESISFAGSASDPEDGALTGASLVWTSSLDGQIGTGTSFNKSDLSVGSHTITLTATDSEGATGGTSVAIGINAAPNMAPVGVAITPDGAFAYVTNTNFGRVSVIATSSNTVVATVQLAVGIDAVAITPDGAFAYVTNHVTNNVSVIEMSSNTIVATVVVGVSPAGVAITPDGAFAYVPNHHSDNVSVIATASNTVVATVVVGVGPAGVAITPDGAFAYVPNYHFNFVHLTDNVSVIATASNTVVATVPLEPTGVDNGGGIVPAITPDGAFAYVADANIAGTVSVIETASNMVVARVGVGAGSDAVAITPDGAFAYVTNRSAPGLSVIETASNTVVATVNLGVGAAGVAITPDGAFAYVTNADSGTVSVIETASNTVVATVDLGR